MKPLKSLPPFSRLATEADFRTEQNTFVLNMEYYNRELYGKTWELCVTDTDTDREALKLKILQGLIYVPNTPVFWNQNPELLLKLKEHNPITALSA